MEIEISTKIHSIDLATREIIRNNIHFIIEHHYPNLTLEKARSQIQIDTGVSSRKVKGWMNDKKLPDLRNIDAVKFCTHYNIPFSDFISKNLKENNISSHTNLGIFIPAEVSKVKIANLFRIKNIQNAEKFDLLFQGIYSKNQYYVFQRKKHSKNITWKFIFACSCILNTPVNYFFE